MFSNARAVSVVSKKRASALGFLERPYAEQSESVQKVGIMMILAPPAMSSRKASGKARSQQMSMPTGPRGVEMTVWGAWVLEVRWGRSGCLGMERRYLAMWTKGDLRRP